MDGQLFGCCTVFIDSFSHRGSVFAAAKAFGLTKREVDIAKHVMQGATNQVIAAALFIAESTAADHVKSVLRKAGCSNRVELVCKIYGVSSESDGSLC